jgi:hypothetical protein
VLDIAWWYSFDGPISGYNDWDANDTIDLAVNAIWVRTALTTTYHWKTTDVAINFVVPEEVIALKYQQSTTDYVHHDGVAGDPIGFGPEDRVKFFTIERKLIPSYTLLTTFLLITPGTYPGAILPMKYAVAWEEELNSFREIQCYPRLEVSNADQ